jgi:hypothetical protein
VESVIFELGAFFGAGKVKTRSPNYLIQNGGGAGSNGESRTIRIIFGVLQPCKLF